MNALVRFALVAFYPRVDDLPGLAELDVDRKIATLRRETTALLWFGVVSAALLFQLTPILTVRRPWPAVFLTEEQLDRHAHLLATHPVYHLRQLIVLLKLMAGMFWGESPELRAYFALPAYPADPASRRVEAHVGHFVSLPPAPTPALVALGKRERDRGRVSDQHAFEEGTVV